MPLGRTTPLIWREDPKAKPKPRVFAKRPDPPPPIPDQVSWRPIDEARDLERVWVRNGVTSGWAHRDSLGWVALNGDPFYPQPTAYLHGKVYEP